MGGAIISGVVGSGTVGKKYLLGCDISVKRLRKLPVRHVADPVSAAKWADVIIFAVKPFHLGELMERVKRYITGNKLVISVVAGKKIDFFRRAFGRECAIIRTMPNTPALIGEGAIALCCSKNTSKAQLKEAMGIFDTVGKTVLVNERSMDAVTAVSGSGPAYLFFLAEIMLEAAKKMGIDRKISEILVRQTLSGAGRLFSAGSAGPAELRRMVTSPGGTTEAAFKVIKKKKIKESWIRAIMAAKKRSGELAG